MQNSRFGELAPKGKISLQERDSVGNMHLASSWGCPQRAKLHPVWPLTMWQCLHFTYSDPPEFSLLYLWALTVSQQTHFSTCCKNNVILVTEDFPAASAGSCWLRQEKRLCIFGMHWEACGLVKCRLARLDCYLNLQPIQFMLTPHTFLDTLAA